MAGSWPTSKWAGAVGVGSPGGQRFYSPPPPHTPTPSLFLLCFLFSLSPCCSRGYEVFLFIILLLFSVLSLSFSIMSLTNFFPVFHCHFKRYPHYLKSYSRYLKCYTQ